MKEPFNCWLIGNLKQKIITVYQYSFTRSFFNIHFLVLLRDFFSVSLALSRDLIWTWTTFYKKHSTKTRLSLSLFFAIVFVMNKFAISHHQSSLLFCHTYIICTTYWHLWVVLEKNDRNSFFSSFFFKNLIESNI